MFRLIVVVFFLSLIIGTYVTGNVVANWAACLVALALLVRARRRTGERPSPAAQADPQSSPPSTMPESLTCGHRLPVPALRSKRGRRSVAGAKRSSRALLPFARSYPEHPSQPRVFCSFKEVLQYGYPC